MDLEGAGVERISKVRAVVLMLVVGVLCGALWVARRQAQPTFEGTPLRAWLKGLDGEQPQAVQERAAEAVATLGRRLCPPS